MGSLHIIIVHKQVATHFYIHELQKSGQLKEREIPGLPKSITAIILSWWLNGVGYIHRHPLTTSHTVHVHIIIIQFLLVDCCGVEKELA